MFPWYRQTKATKRGGMGIGKSEQLVLALKTGDRSEGPVGAKGLPDHGTVGGKDDGSIRSRKRLDETTTDSRAGSADAVVPQARMALAGEGITVHHRGSPA